MASFSAELHVAGHVFPVLHCHYGVQQTTHQRGRVSTKVRYELVHLTLSVSDDDALLAWAAEAQKRQAVSVVFRDANGGFPVETLTLGAAYCVSYQEEFAAGNTHNGAYVCHVVLSDPDGFTVQAGGPITAFVAPAAREHGLPGAATLPFMTGADGVPRLPRITGAPPFTVKGATTVKRRNGTIVTKPGLDRAEYLRQLTGQETGLNRLTVAQFLANRDAYRTRKKTSKRKQPDGRDPKGDAAQQAARQDALRIKIDELENQHPHLARKEVRAQAAQWLETQTALHDPDQIAGGHANLIAGVGNARINSAIGAAWPSRIKAIDQQIRTFAAALTPEQQQNTYLNIHLPVV